MEQKQILEIFNQTKAILKGHFVLTSGRHSDTYMQCAKLFVYPNKAEQICAALCNKLKEINIDYVVSPAVGGIIMGYQVAKLLNKPNLFFERQDGKMTLRRGFELPQGSNVLVVEDVVTTGGSVKEVITQVESMGGKVAAVASIVDRSGGNVDFGKKFVSLLSMEIISYSEQDCPLCKQGLQAYKPGSRDLKH
ncbi:MAG: orotate phosphoribosyltransferase [Clostridia bacterium]|nr:orotate phosphoribosyltransferase [Clostridia bacterium]